MLFAFAVCLPLQAVAQDEENPEYYEPESGGDSGGRSFITQDEAPGRGFHLSLVGTLGSFGAFTAGGGVMVGIPLARNGFANGFNDSFILDLALFTEFVFDFIDYAIIRPVGGVRYEVAFSEAFSAYVGLRLGPAFAVDGITGAGGFFFGSVVGGHWLFARSLGLRAEVGAGTATGFTGKVGLTFFFGG